MTSNNNQPAIGAANQDVQKKPPRRRAPCPRPGSGQANKLAAVILEVLAGVRLPVDAAAQAGISLPRYYQLELRVLDAIVRACEPRPRGKIRSPQRQMEQLQRQVSRLEQECARQQALVRAAHRTIGLAPPAKPGGNKAGGKPSPDQSPQKGKRKRQRKPTVRALKVAKLLRAASEASAPPAEEAAAMMTKTPSAVAVHTEAPPVAERVT